MLVDGIDDTHVSCYGFPTVNRFSLPPVDPNGELVRSMIYRVPADDASTLLYFVRFYPSDKRSFHTSKREVKLGEYAPLASDWWGIDVNDQDRMAVEQQGVIADRPNEHLGVSDGGIIQMRQMMREVARRDRAGQGPALHHPRSGEADRRLPAEIDHDAAEAGRRRLYAGLPRDTRAGTRLAARAAAKMVSPTIAPARQAPDAASIRRPPEPVRPIIRLRTASAC